MPISNTQVKTMNAAAAALIILCTLLHPTEADSSQDDSSIIQIPDLATIATDDPALIFHGIGGLSGGGATARLLIDYPEPQRSEILDILFLPQFAASLHILKVEIGGDSQSTDGTESSHMHSKDDLDCNRGYEWWLLKEAKKRNPDIITYGLPWAFPGWVNDNSGQNPFAKPDQTSEYIIQWLKCARDVHDIAIDLIGLWNESGDPSMGENEYAKVLRKSLDARGFKDVKIVGKDNHADVCDDMAADPDYNDAIYAIGLHYPADYPSGIYEKCHSLKKPFWSSEESSSYADDNGAACWARVIASHFVLSGITSNIMWNLVASYMHGTNWYNSAMFNADQPWTGNYGRDDQAPVVWATAHYTQFTQPNWSYLPVGSGSGELPSGGFYTSLISQDKNEFTFIAVKISRDHAECTRPRLPDFDVEPELITLNVPDSLTERELHLWKSNFEGAGGYFQYLGTADVADDGTLKIDMVLGDVVTVSTINRAKKGTFNDPIPDSDTRFPLPYHDNFQHYAISSEAQYFSDQIGSFEIHYEQAQDTTTNNKFMRQMVPSSPVGWGGVGANVRGPLTIIGQMELNDVDVSLRFRLPAVSLSTATPLSACIGARANMFFTQGIVLCVGNPGNFTLSYGGPHSGGGYDQKNIITTGATPIPVNSETWYSLTLSLIDEAASASFESNSLFEGIAIRDTISGFAVIGCSHWAPVEFDDFHLSLSTEALSTLAMRPNYQFEVGQLLGAERCARNGIIDPRQGFVARSNWQLYHEQSGLCVEADSTTDSSSVRLATCRPNAPEQKWRHRYTNLRNWPVEMALGAYKEIPNVLKLVGYKSGIVASTPGGQDEDWNLWVLFPNTGQLRNTYDEDLDLGYPLCLTVQSSNSTRINAGIVYA